ncbi:hypothetical protein M8J75_003923 [Diaphorina citri]|nr:hypothetical protein M8J75_003923 [Diaphorina citri]
MKADDYDNKIQDFLNTDSIVELNRDPTATLMKNIRQLLTKDNALFQYPMKMYKMNSYPPILYGTLKVHKAGTDGNFASVPIRPVVSGMSSPTYLIEKNIVQLVQSKANWTPTYSVKNSLTLVDKIRNLDIPPNAHLASLDIDNLFSNVDMDMAMHLLHNLVMEHANFTDRQPSYNIAHKLEKNGLKAAFYPLTRLGQTLYNHKNINKMEYSGVYELKCECGAQYIGQTGRSFGARIKEHLAIPKRYAKACRSATEENTPEIKAKYKDKSAMADHLIDSGHNPELCQSKIKHICTIGKRLDILESIEINKIINKPNCLNDFREDMDAEGLMPLPTSDCKKPLCLDLKFKEGAEESHAILDRGSVDSSDTYASCNTQPFNSQGDLTEEPSGVATPSQPLLDQSNLYVNPLEIENTTSTAQPSPAHPPVTAPSSAPPHPTPAPLVKKSNSNVGLRSLGASPMEESFAFDPPERGSRGSLNDAKPRRTRFLQNQQIGRESNESLESSGKKSRRPSFISGRSFASASRILNQHFPNLQLTKSKSGDTSKHTLSADSLDSKGQSPEMHRRSKSILKKHDSGASGLGAKYFRDDASSGKYYGDDPEMEKLIDNNSGAGSGSDCSPGKSPPGSNFRIGPYKSVTPSIRPRLRTSAASANSTASPSPAQTNPSSSAELLNDLMTSSSSGSQHNPSLVTSSSQGSQHSNSLAISSGEQHNTSPFFLGTTDAHAKFIAVTGGQDRGADSVIHGEQI